MEQKIATEIANSHILDPLNDTQIRTLELVKDQANIDRIKEDLEVSQRKAYQILKGLYGNIQGVPGKWQVENSYLKLRDEPEKASIKYELNSRGWKALFVAGSITENCNNQESEQIEGEESTPGECLIRPHYLRSKHMIKRTGTDDDTWFVELKKYFDETEDGTGFNVYWREFRAEVYRDSIQIRLDMPMEEKSVEQVFTDYLDLRDEFLSHVQKRLNGIREGINVQVRSNPEMVEASMLTQEWAEFNSAFANWYYDFRDEIQGEDSAWGGLFVVRNERDEKIAHIDCSEGEPEFEWVHSQEAKNHLQNMKDLVQWGASMEITPQDFSNLKWLRENFEFFDTFYDRLGEQDEICDRLDELESKVGQHEDQISMHAEQMQKHRELISEQDEKIEDAVDRVQTVQVEQDRFQENQEEILDNLESVSEVQEQLQENDSVLVEGIESNSEVNRRMAEAIQQIGGSNRDVQELAESNHQLIREMRKQRLSYRVKKGLKELSGAVATVLGGVI